MAMRDTDLSIDIDDSGS